MYFNEFDQPLGEVVENWQGASFPTPKVLTGWGCRVEPLNVAVHAASLWQAFSEDSGAMWTYFSVGPYQTEAEFTDELAQCAQSRDPQYYAIVDEKTNRALGLASYLRIDPMAGSIEVGWLHFSPALQRTRLASAAMVLMMTYAFELGYRRYEWKCNNLNAPSKRAAERLGFTFEGIFRHARVDKGRNRDTAWFSILDNEWPGLRLAYEAWLDDANFDSAGQQKRKLAQFMPQQS